MRFDKRMIRLAALLAVSAFGLAAAPVSAIEFRGGGAMYGFSGCEAQGWSGANMVRARFTPAADNGGRNTLTLFPTIGGAINFQFDDPLERSNTWRRAWGSAMWQNPGTMDPRPRLRVRGFSITAPDGADLANATDIQMRLQIRRFNWMSSCRINLTLAMFAVE